MGTRRIVTGLSEGGTAIIAADENVDAVEVMAALGARFTTIWGSDQVPSIPTPTTASGTSYFPPPGGFRFVLVELPPDAEAASSAADRDDGRGSVA